MPEDVSLSCACGQFQAILHDASARTGNHGVCYCIDCQAFVRHLNAEDRVMDESGGSEIYQSRPSQLEIIAGEQHMAVLQLTPKGLYRWYASCCATPIGNTLGTPKFSFVGLLVANMNGSHELLGPIQFRYKREQARAPVDGPSGSLLKFAFRTFRNAARARLNGSWRDTPFFDVETGRSVSKPYVLTEAERQKAYEA